MSIKKIYVAGCFDDYIEIRKIQEMIVGYGYKISYDWTIRAEQTIKKRKDSILDNRKPETMAEEAKLDMDGVFDADLTIFYFNKPDYIYRGTFCELGASLMRDRIKNLGKRTIIYTPTDETIYAKTLCFYHHPEILHINSLDKLEYMFSLLE